MEPDDLQPDSRRKVEGPSRFVLMQEHRSYRQRLKNAKATMKISEPYKPDFMRSGSKQKVMKTCM